jgi:RNA polymerase primary sigma factor
LTHITSQHRAENALAHLVEAGRARGALTYDEVSDCLAKIGPTEHVIQRALRRLEAAHVEIVDVKRSRPRTSEEAEHDRKARRPRRVKTDAASEPVQTYLDWMGNVSLLTREGEVELARQIERGRTQLFELVVGSRLKTPELQELKTKVTEGERRAQDAVLDAAFTMTRLRIAELAQRVSAARGKERTLLEKEAGLNAAGLRELHETALTLETSVERAKSEMVEANLRLVVAIA